jgi:hypothetical protein
LPVRSRRFSEGPRLESSGVGDWPPAKCDLQQHHLRKGIVSIGDRVDVKKTRGAMPRLVPQLRVLEHQQLVPPASDSRIGAKVRSFERSLQRDCVSKTESGA